MILFLTVFSVFNLFAAGAGFRGLVALESGREANRWASMRLYLIARAACWGLGMIGLWATAAGWAFSPGLAPLVLAPIVWLLVMGLVFAIVDFAEDGILGNAFKARGG